MLKGNLRHQALSHFIMGSFNINYLYLPGKGLLIAHLNICSLRNKIPELCMVMKSNDIHIMAISETHLDASFENIELAVEGYTLFRKDRTRYGGGVCVCAESHSC